jgi:hypothetical protein
MMDKQSVLPLIPESAAQPQPQVPRLKKSQKRKELTEYLQIPENQSIQNELALFTLSLAPENGGEG